MSPSIRALAWASVSVAEPAGPAGRIFETLGCLWRRLFRQLTADFATLVGGGVNVDVHVAIHQGLGLGVGERGRAFERGAVRADRDHHPGVLAFRGGPR